MAKVVTLNGSSYTVPERGDTGYGVLLTNYLVAIATAFPQLGGTWALASDLVLTAFGVTALYFKSATANIAATGVLRQAVTDFIAWRNNANAADLALGISSADKLTFAGSYLTGNPYAAYTTAVGQSIPNGGVNTIVNFGTLENDTDGAVATGATWKFTVPAGKGGRYSVACAATWSAPTLGQSGLVLFKNAGYSKTLYGRAAMATSDEMTGAIIIQLVAGDTLAVAAYHASAGAVTLTAAAGSNWIQIHKLGD